ncbi:MAG: type II toxin-antitoxin system VapC family toxin [bacterium]|nr:type II toxin-antitoxin system VapC family toxin [bacterium]
MNSIYFDTNIFIYLADASSPYFAEIYALTMHLQKENIQIITSTETIQEIIHVSKKVKQYRQGIKNAEGTLKTINKLVPIQDETIKIFLKKNEIYKLNESRDILHLAVCLENNLDTILTYDGGFKNFKEIKAYTPSEYLKKYDSNKN